MEEGVSFEISNAVEIIKKSWGLFCSKWIIFLPFGIAFGVIQALSDYLVGALKQNPVWVIFVMNLLLTSWLTMLMMRISIQIVSDNQIQLKLNTVPLAALYPTYIAVSILYSVMVVTGFICLILPGIYLAVVFYFADLYVIMGERISFKAFKKSLLLVQKIFRQVFFCVVLIMCFLVIPIFIAQTLEAHQPKLSRLILLMVALVLVPYTNFTKVVMYKEISEIRKKLIEE